MLDWVLGLRLRIVMCSALALALTVVIVGRASALEWSIQTVSYPPGVPAGQLSSVSCASRQMCIAVGNTSAQTPTGFAERWNGSSWLREQLPSPADVGSYGVHLRDVACPSAMVCVAVGSYSNRDDDAMGLVERWNGASWSIQPVTVAADWSSLTAVSCSSGNACTAVGVVGAEGEKDHALVERWNGRTWSSEQTPGSTASTGAMLTDVSCASPGACTAVGSVPSRNGMAARAERWNGHRWTVEPTQRRTGVLNSVSCTSVNACTAVGYVGPGLLPSQRALTIERWNGRVWALQNVVKPVGATTGSFTNVSCASARSCMAIGTSTRSCTALSCARQTLVEYWNGARWAVQPRGLDGKGASLTGLSCTSGVCTAVGGLSGSGAASPLEARSNGQSWSVQPQNDPTAPPQIEELKDVSCWSATGCIAVGRGQNTAEAALWNGTIWSAQNVPTGESAISSLFGVSCTSATFCTAVGNELGVNGPGLAVADRWNGQNWVSESTPPFGGVLPELWSVSCTSATFCMALGVGHDGPFAERWNGRAWTIVTIPAPVGAAAWGLGGLSCTSASACTAVGSAGRTANKPLVETWNGIGWAAEVIPVPAGTTHAALGAVSCVSSTWCVAVGSYASGARYVFLADVWNGSSWTIQSVPRPPGILGSELSGVSCVSTTACTAVGDDQAVNWNGSTWTIEALPYPAGASEVVLESVSCTSATTCTAVGWYPDAGANEDALIEHSS